MKAYVSKTLTGFDSLAIEDVPAPGPLGNGQIRVKMHAASLNFRDTLMIGGAFGPMTVKPLVPCSDGAGEVVEVGADVWRVKVGDRIALTFHPDWIGGAYESKPGSHGRGGGSQGVMAEQLVVSQHEAVLLPPHFSYDEGATLPCAALTAWSAICGPAPLQPGMTVLTQGAGGVSIFALQLAKLFGARVIVTTSSPERCERLKKLGADEAIDYKARPDWDAAVRELTGGVGADVTVELGGASTANQSLAATRIGGRVALVGLLTGRAAPTNGIYVDLHAMKVGSRQDFEAMNRAIGFHKLKPVIDKKYPFKQLPDALKHLQSGKHFGKIVVGID